jgi:hypothetical protein
MFSLQCRVQTGSGANFFPRLKRLGREAYHIIPSSSDEVNNARSYNSIPPYILMMWCLDKHGGDSTLMLGI